jgi:membrane associated rhomboid family serine protease
VLPIRDNVPTRSFPLVTVGLIVGNVLVFLLYQGAGAGESFERTLADGAFRPCELDESCRPIGEPWPVNAFSAMFMHADWLHLGGNMLFLWIFGNNVEDAFGPARFLIFYLLSGLAATALQSAVTLGTAGDQAAQIPNLGASGAVSGVLGAYFVLLPRAQILSVIFLVFIFFLREIPAWFFLGFYFLFQFYQANFQLREPPEGGGVAVFAHIGGFLFGALAVWLFRRRRPLQPAY